MSVYGCFSEVVFRLARPFLNRKYDEGNDQRYGFYPKDLPEKPLWVHAVSVGEVQSAYPFIKGVASEKPDLPVLVSTITKTGKGMASQLIGPLARQIYYPWDAPSVLRRALSSIRPRAYVTIETEIWPEMLNQLYKHGIPAFLVNARLSQSSYEKYERFHRFWQRVIRKYALIMARSEVERERFIALGAEPDKVKVTGDCKVDALIERKNTADLTEVRKYLSDDDSVILAGSTHEGEETFVLKAFGSLLKKHPALRLVIVPRHPERSQAILEEAKALNFGKAVLMSSPDEHWNVMIVDRIGVLFPLYGCVKAAFLGGSIAPRGGQNIMEPAIWGIPFCQGPDYRDFTEATGGLVAAGLCEIVHDAEEMSTFFDRVLSTDQSAAYAEGSRRFFAQLGGASLRSWHYIQEELRAAER